VATLVIVEIPDVAETVAVRPDIAAPVVPKSLELAEENEPFVVLVRVPPPDPTAVITPALTPVPCTGSENARVSVSLGMS